MSFICPNCDEPLEPLEGSNTLRCVNNHCFDCAKQGYYNLLLVNKKASKEPGDTVEMLQARRRFLESGGYAFLVKALAEKVTEYIGQRLQPDTPFSLFDCGCGEGYYTRELQKRVPPVAAGAQVCGIDIAKSGVRMAASAAKLEYLRDQQTNTNAMTWLMPKLAVASSAHLPIPNSSVDVFLSIFAPFSESEVRRVLKDHGVFIRVAPGPQHLWELKQQIYSTPQAHEAPLVPEGMSLCSQDSIGQSVDIESAEHFNDLLSMTPFAYKGMREAKQSLTVPNDNKINAEFFIQVYTV